MKLYVSPRAPSPRRVLMFLVEKGITGIDLVHIDLNAHEHKREAYLAKSPLAKVPALELDDGRVLTETRAICTYLEGLYPEPNLMGVDFDERAFIEMADRRVEHYLLASIANAIRHTHPGLAPLEHCRHHRLLRHRVRTRLDEVQAGRRRFERTTGLARPRGRAAERARVARKNGRSTSPVLSTPSGFVGPRKKRPVGDWGAMKDQVLIRVLGV